MTVLKTGRLRLRELSIGDAEFILELVNEPLWLRFIGDKGVRTLEDARKYIEEGPVASYRRNGFGLYLVERRELPEPAEPIGICGLIRRETLEDVDLGFAFLERYQGRGYARESAMAIVELGRSRFGLVRLVAITTPDNDRSIRVLEGVGFAFERRVRLAADDRELALYARALTRSTSRTPR
jgi:RimJ/RimL family protein N-acetyltransferase